MLCSDATVCGPGCYVGQWTGDDSSENSPNAGTS